MYLNCLFHKYKANFWYRLMMNRPNRLMMVSVHYWKKYVKLISAKYDICTISPLSINSFLVPEVYFITLEFQ